MQEELAVYPRYRRASFDNQFAVMQNDHICVCWFRRLSGWGYAEIYTADGKLMGVLEHLGEILV